MMLTQASLLFPRGQVGLWPLETSGFGTILLLFSLKRYEVLTAQSIPINFFSKPFEYRYVSCGNYESSG